MGRQGCRSPRLAGLSKVGHDASRRTVMNTLKNILFFGLLLAVLCGVYLSLNRRGRRPCRRDFPRIRAGRISRSPASTVPPLPISRRFPIQAVSPVFRPIRRHGPLSRPPAVEPPRRLCRHRGRHVGRQPANKCLDPAAGPARAAARLESGPACPARAAERFTRGRLEFKRLPAAEPKSRRIGKFLGAAAMGPASRAAAAARLFGVVQDRSNVAGGQA